MDTATYISEMDPNIPTAGVQRISELDDNQRNIKQAIVNTLPNFNAAVNATPTQLNKLVDPSLANFGEPAVFVPKANNDALLTGFELEGAIIGSFESIGPTGSAATNINPDLDDIPAEAQGVVFKLTTDFASSGIVTAYIRDTGSAVGSTQDNNVAYQAPASAGFWSSEFYVSLDGANTFEMSYASIGTISSAKLYVIGYYL
ncbi:MAG: hypothetical protein AAF387_21145 [Pseudomonadota bacterium]